MEEPKLDSNSEKKNRTWSKQISKGDDSETIRVEEVSNGFIIEKSTSYKDDKGNYQYKCIKSISFDNPMEPKKDEDDDMDNNMFDGALKAINGLDGGLFI